MALEVLVYHTNLYAKTSKLLIHLCMASMSDCITKITGTDYGGGGGLYKYKTPMKEIDVGK